MRGVTETDVLGWAAFAVAGGVNVATFAYLIGKISATGATMVKAMDSIRSDLNELRSDVTSKLDVLNRTMLDDAKHGASLAAKLEGESRRIDSEARRIDGLEQRTPRRR